MKLDEIPEFLHGGDYNPDQWLDRPDILEDDIRLMKQAGVNCVSVGIFAWSALEPQEGVFRFEWLDRLMDSMYENGIHVILATPSAARPPWMAKKYPEVMRTDANRVRQLYGGRENHCESSKIWREKVRIIDEELSRRYARHPALVMWHLSNEFYGHCYCETCAANFRKWLRHRYGTIENLNRKYWSAFWSHGYSDFDEIEPPAPNGERQLHALTLDYDRFWNDLLNDFVEMEKAAVLKYGPDVPVTTNMHNMNCGVDYYKQAKHLDRISWDSYPRWHCQADKSTEWENAVGAGFTFDYARSLKHAPFYLMESAPSVPSQFEFCKLKRPGMHMLSSLQAIAHGADSVQYFQWRKSRGAVEKFHGAVVSHDGSGDTRVFRDVSEVGQKLKELSWLKGRPEISEAAVIYDYENLQALLQQVGLRRDKSFFEKLPRAHYEALLKNFVNVDVIGAEDDLSRYKLVAAPALYLFRPDTAQRIRSFVEQGGTFVMTCYSGLADENDLAFAGTLSRPEFAPHGLNDVFGLRVKEIDGLCDDEYREIEYRGKLYKALVCCELTEPAAGAGSETSGTAGAAPARCLAVYRQDFYSGTCAAAEHDFGKGRAYYMACHAEADFLRDFYSDALDAAGVKRLTESRGVGDVILRERDGVLFAMNFSTQPRTVRIGGRDVTLPGYGYEIVG